jgi:ribonuclease HI
MKNIEIYTDGACSGNPGPGGWGAVLIFGDKNKEISGSSTHTTNNIMELTAPIESLKTLKEPCIVNIYTDSVYVKNGITTWIHGWKKNGWKTAKKEPVKNMELWIELDEVCKQHTIEWHWVKGHSDNYYNNRADFLATQAVIKK